MARRAGPGADHPEDRSPQLAVHESLEVLVGPDGGGAGSGRGRQGEHGENCDGCRSQHRPERRLPHRATSFVSAPAYVVSGRGGDWWSARDSDLVAVRADEDGGHGGLLVAGAVVVPSVGSFWAPGNW